MEPTEVWPGIDSALHELGMLCSNGSNRGPLQDVPERFRTHSNDINVNANTGKCHDRYLLPSQAWNRPGVLTEVGQQSTADSSQNESLKSNYQLPDVENSENAYAVKGSRIIKLSDPKGGVALENSNPSACRSGVWENGLNVIRMNSHYMTGVTIAIAGASGFVFERSDSYTKSVNAHNTPKHGLSIPSVRHHHVRPYFIPWRREDRARTKSETAEKEAAMKLMDRIDVSPNYVVIDSVGKPNAVKSRRRLLKSRSLENVRLAEDEVLQVPTLEVDSMSNRIQHLHVED